MKIPSIRKEIAKTFSDLINKKSYFPSDLEDSLFHRTFDLLLEIANIELVTPLREEKYIPKINLNMIYD